MKKLVPHLWYDTEARKAAEFYSSIFENSGITKIVKLEDTPSGDAEIVSFKLSGQQFEAISAGPIFKFNHSISLIVKCFSNDEFMEKWKAFLKEGIVLEPISNASDEKMNGSIQDKYGLVWKLILSENNENTQKITVNLSFSDGLINRAKEAMDFYREVFEDEVNFTAEDVSDIEDESFNEAISLIIYCKDQKEIDYYWDKLSFDPEAEQCGWIKDKFGLSWQIVPEILDEMFVSDDSLQFKRVSQAILSMKKLNIEDLIKAYEGDI